MSRRIAWSRIENTACEFLGLADALGGMRRRTDLWLNYDIYGGGGGLHADNCGRQRARKMDEGGGFDRHAGLEFRSRACVGGDGERSWRLLGSRSKIPLTPRLVDFGLVGFVGGPPLGNTWE